MAYENHPDLPLPPGDTAIWRYMSLAKFLSLLETDSLWFARPDTLGDPFEGSVTRPDWKVMKKQMNILYGGTRNFVRDDLRNFINCTAISCWHLNEHESAALWSLYGHEGIAVRSTVARLVDSLACGAETVQMGTVTYIDFEQSIAPAVGLPQSFILVKRRSFEHERELRAFIHRRPTDPLKPFGPTIESGVPIEIDLSTLVEGVYVAPLQPGWYVDSVRGLLSRYGLGVPVRHSQLDDVPL